jgi:hypothetical protein
VFIRPVFGLHRRAEVRKGLHVKNIRSSVLPSCAHLGMKLGCFIIQSGGKRPLWTSCDAAEWNRGVFHDP